MLRVGFVGTPGSGKTSTARAVAAICRRVDQFKKVELIAEYARRYIIKYGAIDSLADQYKIMSKQIEWEDTPAVKDVDLIITDSPVHQGWLYVMEFERKTAKEVMYYNDIFKCMNKVNYPTRYDLIFHMPPILAPVEDGVRPAQHFDETWRTRADQTIQFVFKLFPPKRFVTVQAVDLMERVDECMDYLEVITKKGT